MQSSGYKAYCEEQWRIEHERFHAILIASGVNELQINKRKDYPDDDDMTFARRTKALVIAELGEERYSRWLSTDEGKSHFDRWGRIIDKLGELGT